MDHQKRYEDFLKIPRGWKTGGTNWSPVPFSAFNKKDLDSAVNLASEYFQHAQHHQDNHTKAVHHVLDKAQAHIDDKAHDPEVIRHALLLFGVHHPGARKVLAFPRLIQRAPRLALPSTNNSDPLAWFLEDPNMNEHHEHWHLVYPSSGIPSLGGSRKDKDRQGEVFAFMHKQMLARFDAELICNGLPPVEPFSFDQPIHPGYTPSNHLEESGNSTDPYASRDDGAQIQDASQVNLLKSWANNIQQAIKNGYFTTSNGQVAITPPNLGAVIEASVGPQSDLYGTPNGGLHNNGHGLIASVQEKNVGGATIVGVMSDTRTACRDPVFWQWHRYIDDLYSSWQNMQPVHDWTNDLPPPIKVQAINLAYNDTIGNSTNINDINKFSTTELQTTYLSRTFTWTEDDQSRNVITYLFPREFTYFFNVQNTSNTQISVTFRVFLAPTSKVDSRVHWIELDKFRQDIPASSSPTIVSRNCDLSSVVRKPAQKNYQDLDATAIPKSDGQPPDEQTWCDCGWPFHLLLPRGNENGATFKLFVFVSDWNKDKVPVTSKCGSLSFCGALDNYPDARSMGYPFDRPFKNGTFNDTFGGLLNTNQLDITIKSYPYENAQWAAPYAEQPQPKS